MLSLSTSCRGPERYGKCSFFFAADEDECKKSPCHNGATCMNNVGSFHCLCRPGFEGKLCERGNRVQGNIYGLLTKCEVKWLDIGRVPFFCVFMETESRSINTQKENEALIKNKR